MVEVRPRPPNPVSGEWRRPQGPRSPAPDTSRPRCPGRAARTHSPKRPLDLSRRENPSPGSLPQGWPTRGTPVLSGRCGPPRPSSRSQSTPSFPPTWNPRPPGGGPETHSSVETPPPPTHFPLVPSGRGDVEDSGTTSTAGRGRERASFAPPGPRPRDSGRASFRPGRPSTTSASVAGDSTTTSLSRPSG